MDVPRNCRTQLSGQEPAQASVWSASLACVACPCVYYGRSGGSKGERNFGDHEAKACRSDAPEWNDLTRVDGLRWRAATDYKRGAEGALQGRDYHELPVSGATAARISTSDGGKSYVNLMARACGGMSPGGRSTIDCGLRACNRSSSPEPFARLWRGFGGWQAYSTGLLVLRAG